MNFTRRMVTVLGCLCCWGIGNLSVDAAIYNYSAGHGDIGLLYESGEFVPHFHLGDESIVNGVAVEDLVPAVPENEFDPTSMDVVVSNAARTVLNTVPPGFGFTGAVNGGSIWILPQVQNSDLPFLGFATEELEQADWTTGITWSLTDSSMPATGNFSLWTTGTFGEPNPLFSTASPASTVAANKFVMGIGTHSHFNWGFTAAGIYDIELTASGTHAVDGPVSESANIRFLVGNISAVPEPGSLALLIAGVIGIANGVRSKYRKPEPLVE